MAHVRIGVVMGGTSAERAVSLESGRAVVSALKAGGHNAIPIEIGPGADAVSALSGVDIDVAFLALHGRQGEDGCIQGLLELMGIPYTGSDPLSSALAMNKKKSKELFRLHNVPTPPYYTASLDDLAGGLKELHGFFGFPVVVKPCREGSSIGVSLAGDLGELERAVELAFDYDDTIIVERFIQGRELAVGLLDGRVLGAIEIAKRSEIYDFAAKYTEGAVDYFIPARLSTTRYKGVLNLAGRSVSALGARGAVRVDLLLTEGQNEYVLEVNTLPGLTEHSLLPKIAKAAGYTLTSLCEAMVSRAMLHTTTPDFRAPYHALTVDVPADGLERSA